MREARVAALAPQTAEQQRGSILVVAGSATPVTKTITVFDRQRSAGMPHPGGCGTAGG